MDKFHKETQYAKIVKSEKWTRSIQVFFSWNLSSNDAPTWRHFPCIFKNVEVGYCGKLSLEGSSGCNSSLIYVLETGCKPVLLFILERLDSWRVKK